jgi:hypothetical protein
MDEIADILWAAVSTDDFPVQVETGYVFNPTPPAIDVYPGDPSGDLAAAGFGNIEGALFFTVRARVQTADTTEGQRLLVAFGDIEDDLSIAQALMADQTLGGHANSVLVAPPIGFRQYVDAGQQGSLLGREWLVTVLRAYS